MTQNFTPNDVLLANSGELPDELRSLLQLSLLESAELSEFSIGLKKVESGMEQLIPETDEKQVQTILDRIRSGEKKY